MDDDYSTEYHLTPDGWMEGTQRFFREISGEEVERPHNAVETWEHRATQRSMWSRESHHVRMLWYDESTAESERKALHAKFKRPFPRQV